MNGSFSSIEWFVIFPVLHLAGATHSLFYSKNAKEWWVKVEFWTKAAFSNFSYIFLSKIFNLPTRSISFNLRLSACGKVKKQRKLFSVIEV